MSHLISIIKGYLILTVPQKVPKQLLHHLAH